MLRCGSLRCCAVAPVATTVRCGTVIRDAVALWRCGTVIRDAVARGANITSCWRNEDLATQTQHTRDIINDHRAKRYAS